MSHCVRSSTARDIQRLELLLCVRHHDLELNATASPIRYGRTIAIHRTPRGWPERAQQCSVPVRWQSRNSRHALQYSKDPATTLNQYLHRNSSPSQVKVFFNKTQRTTPCLFRVRGSAHRSCPFCQHRARPVCLENAVFAAVRSSPFLLPFFLLSHPFSANSSPSSLPHSLLT